MSTKITGQREFERISSIPGEMGVASPSTKRRLGAPEGDDVVSTKMAKKHNNNNNNNNHTNNNELISSSAPSEDTIANENSSDFLTTSILARTLLTSSSSSISSCSPSQGCYLTSDPLESLKSSLEALPAPAALDSCEGILRPTFISPSKRTIHHDTTDLEFTSLLCHERPLVATTVTVLSPIDESNLNGARGWGTSSSSIVTTSTTKSSVSMSISSLNQQQQQHNHHQVITEDENGKSYFNLGSADATIVARRSSISSLSSAGDPTSWTNSCNSSNNNNNDFDDNASSSSCESISSEDLFNSGEEFDASDDDDDELCTYKQQRSTVLHLSLCKLNKFRSQQCVEPSLHRSVLICNTLRHIEQEIKNEDEVDESLKSREKLPSFWRSTSNHHHCFSNNNNSSSQPQITDSRPNSNPLLCPNGHDPYLSPNPYSNNNNNNNNSNGVEAPYLSYDYNSLRPTPYHTTSYEYEHDLPPNNPNTPDGRGGSSSPTSQSPLLSSEIANVATSTLLECDSGYGDDLDLTSYYYSGTPPPPPQLPQLAQQQQQHPPSASSQQSLLIDNTCSSTPSSVSTSSNCPNGSVIPTSDNPIIGSPTSAYLTHSHCGFPVPVERLSPPHESESSSNPSMLSSASSATITEPSGGINIIGKCDMGDVIDMDMDISNSSSNSSNGSRSPPTPTTSACDYLQIRNHSLSENSQSPHVPMCWSTSTTTTKTQTTSSLKDSSSLPLPTSSSALTFAQQDSQCGLESRRSDLSISNHFNNHNLPMENLISSTYSSSL